MNGIDRFWSASWPVLRAELVSALDHGAALPDGRVRQLIEDIDEGLLWEFGHSLADDPSKPFFFTLSPELDPKLREVTEAWHRAAPDDPDFEFQPAIPPVPFDKVISIPSYHPEIRNITLADARVGIIETPPGSTDPADCARDGDHVHVVVLHPMMAELGGDDGKELWLALRILVGLLGEDEVMRRAEVVVPPSHSEDHSDTVQLQMTWHWNGKLWTAPCLVWTAENFPHFWQAFWERSCEERWATLRETREDITRGLDLDDPDGVVAENEGPGPVTVH